MQEFLQTALPTADLTVMVAIKEGTPDLHLLFAGVEEVALTPDPVHAHAQGPIPPVVVALGHGLDHGLGLDLVRMSVEGEFLGGGGDRLRGK